MDVGYVTATATSLRWGPRDTGRRDDVDLKTEQAVDRARAAGLPVRVVDGPGWTRPALLIDGRLA